MDSRCFIFDLVILNVWVPEFDYENNSLTVEVCFIETEFTIESNPEKAGDFTERRTYEFEAYPDELRNDLLDRPLKLRVKTNGDEVVGEADISWPRELLDKLKMEQFMQYSHFDQCDLMLEQMVTGRVGIKYRLRAKCESSEDENDAEDKQCDIQNELKRIVNPNELFFLIQNGSDVCSLANDNDKQKVSRPTALDLSKFKNFHGKVVQDTGVFDRVYSLDCCHTKKYPASKCKGIPGGMTSKPTYSHYERQLMKCPDSKSSKWACKATHHVRECPHSNKFSDETTAGSCSCDCVETRTDVFDNGKMKNICHYPETPPVLKETVYIRPRLCPICNSNVSWLPKMAACPKCGHKPTPYVVDRLYNENLTADEVLKEWTIDKPSQNLNTDKGPKRVNRCACRNGKVCPYCRIRKLCRDVLKTKNCCDPKGKISTDSAVSLKDISPEKNCKSTSGTDSRAYLARVFSELRDLYNFKPDMKKRGFELNKPCERVFDRPKPSKRRLIKRNIQKIKADLSKSLVPNVKAKWCEGKLYNYKTVRDYPGTSIGHKTCVSSGKTVPNNMGWLWNTDTVGVRRGWKPGAIRKPIKEIMKYFLKDFPVDSLRVSRYARKKVAQKDSEDLVQKPTLHICKKNGMYIITMRPLKDATLLKNCANPYASMKPIQFKIVKNPLTVHTSQMKKELKKQFHKCTCHKPVSGCYCRTYLDKKRMEFELSKACRREGIPNLKDTLVLSDTTDSEVEFDFGVTPPAGVIKPELKKKPDLVCHETQYNEEDWIIKPCLPMKVNKYMKPNDLLGERMIDAGAVKQGAASGGRGGGAIGSGSRSGGAGSGARGRGRFRSAGGVGGSIPGRADGGNRLGGRGGDIGGGNGVTHGGRGGIGSGIGGANPTPLFCNLARRRKAEPFYCDQPLCKPCMPIC